MTVSAIYAGEVRHRRHAAQPGSFTLPVTLAYLDLEELPRLLGGSLVRRRPGLIRMRRRDLHGDGGDVATAVRALVAARTGEPAPGGPVRVLAMPRTLGVGFNPVAFYYCFDAHDALDAVVAEVTNTPWGGRHAYVLRGSGARAPGGILRGTDAKALHVSPFQSMEHTYEWAVSAPGRTASVHIASHRAADGSTDFDATLKLERRPLERAALVRAGGPARARPRG